MSWGVWSFQSSTGSVAGCNGVNPIFDVVNHHVSILNRLCGRMQQRKQPWRVGLPNGFNPQPALWPDATTRRRDRAGQHRRVSILNRLCGRMQPDATAVAQGSPLMYPVSILNRLCGRMQPPWRCLLRGHPPSIVSILNRLCGRMQPSCRRTSAIST